MEKGAQVTLFVIVGIAFVAALGVILFFRDQSAGMSSSSQLSERESLGMEERLFAESVDMCVEKTLKEAILKVSRNGGDYPAGDDSLSYKDYSVPIYYDNGKEQVRSIGSIMSKVEGYMSRNMGVCVNSIGKSFEPAGSTYVKVTFGDEARAEAVMPVILGNAKLSNFIGEAEIDYNLMYGDMKSFYNTVKEFNESFDLMALAELAKTSKYRFSYDHAGDSAVYILRWGTPALGEDMEFPFAVRKKESIAAQADIDSQHAEGDEDSDGDMPPEESAPVADGVNVSAVENDEKAGELVAGL